MAAPKQFRIFRAGLNTGTKGQVLFDDQAAKDVMAAYGARNGVKVMIDLEHMSLDDEAPNYDPDARGWAELKVIGGELWAVAVEWTPDGEKRLNNKTQRYVSPAFQRNKETNRVQQIFNIALVGMPATNAAQDLLATSRVSRFATKTDKPIDTITLSLDLNGEKMPPELLEMLGLSPEATAEDVTAAVKALLGKDSASAGPPPGEKPTEEMAKLSAQVLALTERVKKGDAAVAELKSIKDKEKTEKHSALVAKLPKSLEAWGQKQSVEVLESYHAAATPADVEIPPVVTEVLKDGVDVSKATDAEIAACKATGTPIADFLKFKATKNQAA